MKVLHFNQSDIYGGASIASHRLHQGLTRQGVESHLLVGDPKEHNGYTAKVPDFGRFERLLERINTRLGLKFIHKVSSFTIPRHPFYKTADILNFHNIHGGYFNYLALPQLTQHKPAVLTLHDMWSFTGHCSYSYDCDRWKTGCGVCPYPETYPKIERDSTRLEWRLKNWTYGRTNLTVVAPSRWLTDEAKQSILNQFDIRYIPNGIDLDVYKPLDMGQCRAELGVPNDKQVLMFAADNLSDSRKGGDLLIKTLQTLPPAIKENLFLLTFGNGSTVIDAVKDIPSLSLGFVSGDRQKATVYAAADLLVCPTRADNLPLVLQEAMACGTPMVSFKVGGVPDLVRPGITGYLAHPEDTQDLANGIVDLLTDNDHRQQMRHDCRQLASQEFSLEGQVNAYTELYEHLLASHPGYPL